MMLPRFRVRALMAIVALTALTMSGSYWLVGWTDAAERYRIRAKEYAEEEDKCRGLARVLRHDPTYADKGAMLRWLAAHRNKTLSSSVMAVPPEEWAAYWKFEAVRLEKKADNYAELQRKYVDASRRPWVPIAYDQPPPN